MRYYLDTNILIFILTADEDSISVEVSDIIQGCSNVLYTSSVAVTELLLLYRIGKLKLKGIKSETDLLNELTAAGIEILYFNRYHFAQYAKLEIADSHKDMNDHTIIAQAIADKIPLISSDRAFKNYVSRGLDFIFNKR
jgi:PIN domain nuclease of toxin-antitoxin system